MVSLVGWVVRSKSVQVLAPPPPPPRIRLQLKILGTFSFSLSCVKTAGVSVSLPPSRRLPFRVRLCKLQRLRGGLAGGVSRREQGEPLHSAGLEDGGGGPRERRQRPGRRGRERGRGMGGEPGWGGVTDRSYVRELDCYQFFSQSTLIPRSPPPPRRLSLFPSSDISPYPPRPPPSALLTPPSVPVPVQSERIYFSPFSLCGYSFSLIADPGGNPRAANQAQAAGAPRVEKGLSVYLTVEFQNGLPDTPLWGGGFLSHPEFPPPPLQVGPGHPWLGTGEAGINGEGSSGGGGDGGGLEEGSLMVAGPEGRLVPRDPHGLRRRRRRYRMREGRIKGISQVRDPSVIERGCCAAFSLSAVNQAGLKDVMWVSSMDDDRFFPGRSSWGVHCLLPTSKIQVRSPTVHFCCCCGTIMSTAADVKPTN